MPRRSSSSESAWPKTPKEAFLMYFADIFAVILALLIVVYVYAPSLTGFIVLPSHNVTDPDDLPASGPGYTEYGMGNRDLFYLAFLVLVWIEAHDFFRELVWDFVAKKAQIKDIHKARFPLDLTYLVYLVVYFMWGFNTSLAKGGFMTSVSDVWVGYPHTMHWSLKVLVLSAVAYWIQCYFYIFVAVKLRPVEMERRIPLYGVNLAVIALYYGLGFQRLAALLLMVDCLGHIPTALLAILRPVAETRPRKMKPMFDSLVKTMRTVEKVVSFSSKFLVSSLAAVAFAYGLPQEKEQAGNHGIARTALMLLTIGTQLMPLVAPLVKSARKKKA